MRVTQVQGEIGQVGLIRRAGDFLHRDHIGVDAVQHLFGGLVLRRALGTDDLDISGRDAHGFGGQGTHHTHHPAEEDRPDNLMA